jgi:hypothetical protein
LVSAHYTYWVEQTLAGPGQYAVSALVNGRAVGLHHFSVEAGASVPDQDDHDDHDRDTPDTTLATGLGVFAPHRRQQAERASSPLAVLRRCWRVEASYRSGPAYSA